MANAAKRSPGSPAEPSCQSAVAVLRMAVFKVAAPHLHKSAANRKCSKSESSRRCCSSLHGASGKQSEGPGAARWERRTHDARPRWQQLGGSLRSSHEPSYGRHFFPCLEHINPRRREWAVGKGFGKALTHCENLDTTHRQLATLWACVARFSPPHRPRSFL